MGSTSITMSTKTLGQTGRQQILGSCQGRDGLDYYGIVKEIIEVNCDFGKKKNPVVFKCHWFNPTRVRRRPEIGLVEIVRESVYAADDVYILAHQAIQVFFISSTHVKL